jgi:hypothetical protein
MGVQGNVVLGFDSQQTGNGANSCTKQQARLRFCASSLDDPGLSAFVVRPRTNGDASDAPPQSSGQPTWGESTAFTTPSGPNGSHTATPSRSCSSGQDGDGPPEQRDQRCSRCGKESANMLNSGANPLCLFCLMRDSRQFSTKKLPVQRPPGEWHAFGATHAQRMAAA